MMWTEKLVSKAGSQLFERLLNVGHGSTGLCNVDRKLLKLAAEQHVSTVEGLLDPVDVAYDMLDEAYSYDGGREVLDKHIENDFGMVVQEMLINLSKIAQRADSLPEVFFASYLLLCGDIDAFSAAGTKPIQYNRGWSRGYGTRSPGFTQLGCQIWIGKRRIDFVIRHDKICHANSLAYQRPNIIFIEIDSFSYHMNKRSMLSDRQRDREHLREGIITIRFMAKEIFQEPEKCMDDLEKIYSSFVD